MIQVDNFFNFIIENEITYFTGVPDSQLEVFCNYINSKADSECNHIIAANEGNAVALAAGYYMSTGKVGLVYMQNSGLGNAINPITSLTDPEVYGIPVIYMIGWRGQPGIKDEPQHIKQGKITLELLDILGISYMILDETSTLDDIKDMYFNQFEKSLQSGKSVAFVVSKNAFSKLKTKKIDNDYPMSREEAIQIIADCQNEGDITVSTTGKASRELFEYRDKKGLGHCRDFLTVGSMGHAPMIAMSIAEHTNRKVWCIDGDGAMLMHTGASALIGNRKPSNLYHILLNNGVHETVGGMPTISYSLNWGDAVSAFGYKHVYKATSQNELKKVLKESKEKKGPVFIEVMINTKSREDLTRPTIKPIDNKKNIMNYIMEKNKN